MIIEPGRKLHAVVTGCDDAWECLSGDEREIWAQGENEIVVARVRPNDSDRTNSEGGENP